MIKGMRKKWDEKSRPIVRKEQSLFENNQGSAILMVLVAMAFIGILASVIMYITLVNYRVKLSDQKAKDSFYSAEQALEEIKAGLSRYVSEAFSTAYIEVMQSYEGTDTNRQLRFKERYRNLLSSSLKKGTNPGQYDVELLKGFVTVPAADPDTEGVIVGSEDPRMLSYTDGVRLMDIKVTYTDGAGYVSIIQTDIFLKIPEIILGSTAKLPELLDFTLIANEELTISSGKSMIKGSVYGGSNGISLNGGTQLSLEPYRDSNGSPVPVRVITDRLVTVGVGKMTIGFTPGSAVFKTAEGVSLWADGILVDGETTVNTENVRLEGISYIQDDLTIQGKGNKVKLIGDYIGYGNESLKAESSSSILINGTKATLDMSELNTLLLAGNAYIGTSKLETEELNTVNKDIRMGASVASKAEQLAYLVPIECIGYDVQGKKTLMGKNPVSTRDQVYMDFQNKLKQDEDKYLEVNLDLITDTLDKPLSNYGASYEKIYQKVNQDTVWVYYYLNFPSTNNANRFFRDYFEKSPEQLKTYIANYVSDFQVNENLFTGETGVKMDIAGNMVTVKPGSDPVGKDTAYELIPASATGSAEEQMRKSQEALEYANQFTGLCKRLIIEYASLTGKECNSSLFENIIVSMQKLNKEFPNSETIFENPGNVDIKAMLIQGNDGTMTAPVLLSSVPADVHLLITDRDVTVDRDFKGLIISGGKVKITGNCTIEVYENIVQCFNAEYTKPISGEKVNVTSLFNYGEKSTIGTAYTETLTAKELIIFKNWTKK